MLDEIFLKIGSTTCKFINEFGGYKLYSDICSYEFQYYFGVGFIIGFVVIAFSILFKKK